MLYLDSENKKDMNLYINCSGGEVRGAAGAAPLAWRRAAARTDRLGGHVGSGAHAGA